MGSNFEKEFWPFYTHYLRYYENFKRYGEVTLKIDLKDNNELQDVFMKSENTEEFEKNMVDFWLKRHQFILEHFTDIKKAYNDGHKTIIVKSAAIDPATNYNCLIADELYDYLWNHCIRINENKGLACIEIERVFYFIEIFNNKGVFFNHIIIREEKFGWDSIIHAIPTT